MPVRSERHIPDAVRSDAIVGNDLLPELAAPGRELDPVDRLAQRFILTQDIEPSPVRAPLNRDVVDERASYETARSIPDRKENDLVLELPEGETLSALLAKGPLPLEQTLRYPAPGVGSASVGVPKTEASVGFLSGQQ